MDLLVDVAILLGGLIVFALVVAWLYGGSGAQLLDWDPSERLERRLESEGEDFEEMLEQHNRRRRAQNLPAHSEDELRALVARERRRSAPREGGPGGE